MHFGATDPHLRCIQLAAIRDHDEVCAESVRTSLYLGPLESPGKRTARSTIHGGLNHVKTCKRAFTALVKTTMHF